MHVVFKHAKLAEHAEHIINIHNRAVRHYPRVLPDDAKTNTQYYNVHGKLLYEVLDDEVVCYATRNQWDANPSMRDLRDAIEYLGVEPERVVSSMPFVPYYLPAKASPFNYWQVTMGILDNAYKATSDKELALVDLTRRLVFALDNDEEIDWPSYWDKYDDIMRG